MGKNAQNMQNNMQNATRVGKLLLNLPSRDMRMIEALVRTGRFSTKSEAVRFAIKKALYDEERMREFDEVAKEVQQRVKELGLTKKDIKKAIEEVKDDTRREVKKMLKKIERREK